MVFAAQISPFGLLMGVMFFLVVAGILYFALTFDFQALGFLLLGSALFLVLLGVGSTIMKRINDPELDNVQAVAIAGEAQAKLHHVAHAASTEALWEHLNRSRIVLDSADQRSQDEKASSPAGAGESGESDDTAQSTATHEVIRPSWVNKPAKRVGKVYRVAVSSDRYHDVEECHQALEPKLCEVVHQRIKQLTPSGSVPTLDELGLGLDYVLREICHEEWVETVEASFGEMKIVHVQMEFDAAVDKQLRTAVTDYQRRARINQVGGIAGLGLGGLALLFGLLKMDTWTRGYYSKRLFLGVPAVIIGLLLLFVS